MKVQRGKAPLYQRLMMWTAWSLGAFIVGGSLLDAIQNASSLMTARLTYSLTSILLVVWIASEILVRKCTPLWRLADGSEVRLKRPGLKFRLSLIGFLAITWLPRVFSVAPEVKGLELILGESVLVYDRTYDLVYAIPRSAKAPEVIISHIPLYLHNPVANDRSFEDVTISFHYPKNPSIGIAREVRRQAWGVKEAGSIVRRSEVFEGYVSSYLHVDGINPGETFFLAEPIEFSSEFIEGADAPRVKVRVVSKNLSPRELTLDVGWSRGWDRAEVEGPVFSLIYRRVVLNRQRSSFVGYLRQSLRRERGLVTFVYPNFRHTSDSHGHLRLVGDGLHDRVFYATYELAPLDYLLAPYKERGARSKKEGT